MIEFLFLDLDDTILDFQRAERIAISKTLRQFGVEPVPERLELYSRINLRHWQMLERGELTRDQVLVQRFAVLFSQCGVPADAETAAGSYEHNLSIGHYFLPGAEEAMEQLHQHYRLFLTSNGTASVQDSRMTSANLYRFFENVFISQKIGYNKPSKAYFDACFEQISGFSKEHAMIVGDSLTSDIRGGNNAGIRTCWVNPRHMSRDPQIRVDYEIESLSQLPRLLQQLQEGEVPVTE